MCQYQYLIIILLKSLVFECKQENLFRAFGYFGPFLYFMTDAILLDFMYNYADSKYKLKIMMT